MAIMTRTSEGYQQVEMTQESRSLTGIPQQVISRVPCTKHLPIFFAILLADVFMFAAILLFAIYANGYGGGFAYERNLELPHKQLNLHALIMLTGLVYLNGQAITVYKANYLVKHKSINMLYHFLLQLLITAGLAAGLFMSFEGQEASQLRLAPSGPISHYYSAHSWVGLIAVGLFVVQFLFGMFGFLVTLCCRKLTARFRSRVIEIRKMLTTLLLCISVAAVISGLTQLARFELDGQEGRELYRNLATGGLLINLSAMSVIAGTILIFIIRATFERRQAQDLPILFKSVLLVTQFVELVLMLVIAEIILQLVTPHLHRAINSNFIGNTSLNHIIGNASDSINQLISSAKRQLGGQEQTTGVLLAGNSNTSLGPIVDSTGSPVIQLGSLNGSTTGSGR